MIIPVGRTYTATRTGSIIKRIKCEACERSYYYKLTRSISSSATSPLFLNNERAAAVATAGVDDDSLADELHRNIRLVPCPSCGWYQSNMVCYARRRWAFLVTLGALLLYGGGLQMYISSKANQPFSFDDWATRCLVAGLGLLIAGICLRFVYTPNLGSAVARKQVGARLCVSETEAAEFADQKRPGSGAQPDTEATHYVDSKGKVFSELP